MKIFKKVVNSKNKLKRKPLSNTEQDLIVKANTISNKINVWLGNKIHENISFGENCTTSTYLKKTSNKNASYPFDWIFSSPEIILHALKDDFKLFLDKDQIFQVTQNKAGHQFYHSKMFNHRSPLKSDEDYNYYERAVNRLKLVLETQKHSVFVITIIKEPEKRLDWSNGFDKKIDQPVNQSLESFKPLVSYIKQVNPNSKFLFLSQVSEGKPYINLDYIDDTVIWVDFISQGACSGTKYRDIVDDTIAKIIFQGLYNKPLKQII
ncbi:DUF1796 family putative cysteine peptidase [Thalassobellus sediminis]|uniref:DUF1796 family putative cysteine peptidase n=1 Tax=Thalassobellus sediminis TaxID=3367753 RepID=UPI00379D3E96